MHSECGNVGPQNRLETPFWGPFYSPEWYYVQIEQKSLRECRAFGDLAAELKDRPKLTREFGR